MEGPVPSIQLPNGPNYYNSATQQLTFSLTIQNTPPEILRGRPLSDFGFRCFSQNDEDGILLYIFSLIGHGNRLCIELGCGYGVESNTANLLINHHWYGLLVDGNNSNIEGANHFYSHCQDTLIFKPATLNSFITRENVNSIVQHQVLTTPIDLLSIDLDGNDWWIWEAITAVKPRVVVIESPPNWEQCDSFTIPYQKDFVMHQPSYYGASPLALARLGKRKGYHLMGCSKYGTNLFFIRDDIQQQYFPEVSVASCYENFRTNSEVAKRKPRAKQQHWIHIKADGTADDDS